MGHPVCVFVCAPLGLAYRRTSFQGFIEPYPLASFTE